MSLPTAARIFGVIYLVVGGLGFVRMLSPALPDPPHLVIGTTVFLFGLFAVNVVHNIIHIGIGLGGLLAGGQFGSARSYFRFVAVVYVLLVICGLIPLTNTFFGIAPLFGHDIWLHALTAIAAIYFARLPAPVDEAA
ncbi:MAG: DUF4383 domain-containing protein [Candidatus Eremiobacteraeota bacterium]|nr:DUF4383 domain-containing protein [Candidatus Eremiobacteraeota bacterium]